MKDYGDVVEIIYKNRSIVVDKKARLQKLIDVIERLDRCEDIIISDEEIAVVW